MSILIWAVGGSFTELRKAGQKEEWLGLLDRRVHVWPEQDGQVWANTDRSRADKSVCGWYPEEDLARRSRGTEVRA